MPPALAEEGFDSFALDDRIRKAVAHVGWSEPTLVQAQALPLALQGKDVLAKARTGSGKTGAYCLPILQKLLEKEGFNRGTALQRKGPAALILVPSRELVEQVRQVMASLTYFAPTVSVASLTSDQGMGAQKSMLSGKPSVLISTPALLAKHLNLKNVHLRESVEMLVLDEADMLLSFGFEEDIKSITKELPNICQSMLMSATLGEDVEKLKSLVMSNPVILRLEGEESEEGQLSQFSLRCSGSDKFLISYVLLKLGILQGKVLFFVNNVDRCYELKLFLEQFSIRAAVLNSELPQNSRSNIIQSFNRGIFNYVIATDESVLSTEMDDPEEEEDEDIEEEDEDADEEEEEDDDDEEEEEEEEDEEEEEEGDEVENEDSRTTKQKRALMQSNKKLKDLRKAVKAVDATRDKEYGVSRGVDFKQVDTVVNFDVPKTLRSYTHRAGRTARAGASGTALSLVSPEESKTLDKIADKQEAKGIAVIQPLPFNLQQVEGFRYRAEDSLRRVSRLAIKRARLREIESELINAEKLKEHFSQNPQDLKAIKHDRALAPNRVEPHLAKVPSYLLPPVLKAQMQQSKRDAKRRANDAWTQNRGKKRKGDDPLKTFVHSDGPTTANIATDDDQWASAQAQKLKTRYERKRMEGKRKKQDKAGRGKINTKKAKKARPN